jgi:hypothetical protein
MTVNRSEVIVLVHVYHLSSNIRSNTQGWFSANVDYTLPSLQIRGATIAAAATSYYIYSPVQID